MLVKCIRGGKNERSGVLIIKHLIIQANYTEEHGLSCKKSY